MVKKTPQLPNPEIAKGKGSPMEGAAPQHLLASHIKVEIFEAMFAALTSSEHGSPATVN